MSWTESHWLWIDNGALVVAVGMLSWGVVEGCRIVVREQRRERIGRREFSKGQLLSEVVPKQTPTERVRRRTLYDYELDGS